LDFTTHEPGEEPDGEAYPCGSQLPPALPVVSRRSEKN